jgi:hypothetical protein
MVTCKRSMKAVMSVLWLSGIGLGLAALLATGCGASNVASARGGTAPVTWARAIAYAHAVNLRPSDWLGSKASSKEREIHQTRLGADMARCGGAVPLFEAGGIESPSLIRPSKPEIVVSIIHFVASATIARQQVAADRSSVVRSCIARAYETSLNQPLPIGEHLSHVTVAVPLIRVPGTGGSVGLDLLTTTTVTRAATPTAGATTMKAHSSQDILVFASGPVELAVADVQPTPSLTHAERRLLSLLHSRAEAHSVFVCKGCASSQGHPGSQPARSSSHDARLTKATISPSPSSSMPPAEAKRHLARTGR